MQDASHGQVTRVLRIFLLAFGLLWAAALLTIAVQHFVFHQSHPYDSFLIIPTNRFWDFTVFAPRYALWGKGDQFFTYPGFPFTYPAPTLIAGLFFYKWFSSPLQAYLLSVIAFALAAGFTAAWAVLKQLGRAPALCAAAILSASVFSYPLIFLLDRANMEGLVWMASATGVALFLWHRFTGAAVFLALAASMKIFPGALLLLFLAQRRYREFALALAACAVFTIASLQLAGPDFLGNARYIAAGMDNFRHIEILEYHPSAVGFDHSLFALVKQAAHFFVHDVKRLESILPLLYVPYFAVACASFGLLYVVRLRSLPILNQILALSAVSIVLPFVSYDYTLLHMFVPFAALIFFFAHDVARGHIRLASGPMLAFLLPYAILLTPQNYLRYGIVGFGGQLKCVALLCIIAAAVRIELPGTLFGEIPESTGALDLAAPFRGSRAQPPKPGKSPGQEHRVA